MTPTVKGANFHGQDALRIEQGGLVAILLPRLGGRVISLVVDGVDLFWHDPRLAGPPEALAAIPRPVWWGGWKTWVAPQSRWKGGAPQRDLDEGAWRHEIPTDPATGHWFVRMTSPVDRETGLEIVREVAMIPESSALRARVTFTNRGAPGPLEAGIWEVLQLKKPAQVTVPVDRGHFADEQGVRTYATECDSRAARPKHVRTREDAAGRRAEIRCS
ncbi:MAG TPA: hypothetical protein VHF22_00530, partial [Planctomycetota bacterium]|nr:hypothetical protein [Planctomycetota bacterium]